MKQSPAPSGGSTTIARPVTAFLSYARTNRVRVAALQRELKLRGVRAWRDVTDLPVGAPTPETITRAIRVESDAFVAYVTPEFLQSDFIWRVEIPQAVARHEEDPLYRIIPVFDGVTPARLTARCEAAGQIDLSRFNGGFADARGRSRKAALKGIARATLQAVVGVRFEEERERQIHVSFQTGAFRTHLPGPDLEIDWRQDFVSPCPTEDAWVHDLLPALHDVREVVAVSVPSRQVVAEIYARLSPALAFGHALSEAARLHLTLRDEHGDWAATRGRPGRELLRSRELAASGPPDVGIVEVAVARETNFHATEILQNAGTSAGRRIHLQPLDGPGPTAISGAADAADMARQVASLMRSLHDEGVKEIHLFVAAPPTWAALLGHLLSAVGEVVVYQWDSPSGYQRGCTVR